MTVWAAALLFGAIVAPAAARARPPVPPRFSAMTAAQREETLAPIRRLASVATRLERVTRHFLGTPYGFSPLGEGSGIDPDPLLRFDRVDCLTFAETSIALAAAPDPPSLLPILEDIRYAAQPPTFQNRNHFVEAQWVPNNVLKGWIRDISAQVAPGEVRVATKVLGPQVWRDRRGLGDLPLDGDDVPRGTFRLDYVPLAFLQAHPRRIPSGTLMFVVRENYLSSPTRVSHVGFIFQTSRGPMVRHASEVYRRVVDEPLSVFLAQNAAYRRWPVVGLALFEVRLPVARIDRLASVSTPRR